MHHSNNPKIAGAPKKTRKEKPDAEAGAIGWAARICWFVLFLIPWSWTTPVIKVCRNCEKQGYASIRYVIVWLVVFLGFFVFAGIMSLVIRR